MIDITLNLTFNIFHSLQKILWPTKKAQVSICFTNCIKSSETSRWIVRAPWPSLSNCRIYYYCQQLHIDIKKNLVLTIENNQIHSTAMTGKKLSCLRKTFQAIIICSDTLQRLIFLWLYLLRFFLAETLLKIFSLLILIVHSDNYLTCMLNTKTWKTDSWS